MKKYGRGHSRIVVAASSAFLGGAFVAGVWAWNAGNVTESPDASGQHQVDVRPAINRRGAAASPSVSATLSIGDLLTDLRNRRLHLPLRGATRASLRDSFYERRGATGLHEAIDILAPRNTPIVAVENGTIARLFVSKAGGITVYQFDPTVSYVYYYAHLERYADGLQEGDHVRRTQVLGYVGTSGNAPKDTPHLHFAIFRLTEKKQWWHGSPIDPYEVLTGDDGPSTR